MRPELTGETSPSQRERGHLDRAEAGHTAAASNGPRYWRSVDDLTGTPEFNRWMEQEFPQGANEFTDPVSRRHFVQIMSASFVLAGLGLSGCRRPVERILPFSQKPQGYVHGVPEYYATAMPTRSGAHPLLVRSNDGRPTKVEGNTLHPLAKTGEGVNAHGATDHYAQASVLSLYDPDRTMRFAKGGGEIKREAALDVLTQAATNFSGTGGNGLAFLLDRSSSPSRARLVVAMARKYPNARWYVHEPVDFFVHQQAATAAFGKSVRPFFRYDQAQVIVSLDCDFLGSEENTVQACRDFARGRRITKPGDAMSRLYAIEPMMTLTGANADHRLRLAGNHVLAAAALLVERVAGQSAGALSGALKNAGALDEKSAAWVSKCAEDLARAKGKGLVVAGHRQPLAVHLAAHAINAAVGSVGTTVTLHDANEERFGSITELAQALNGGAVDTLVIVGGNPVYNAPADLDWKNTQRKAKTVIRWGYYEDETGSAADYHFPATHYLESWGDALAFDGSLLPIQPLIEPLFGGMTELEFLARVGGLQPNTPYEIVRETFKEFIGDANLDQAWTRFLHDGFLANSALPQAQVQFNAAAAAANLSVAAAPPPTKDQLEVVFYRDYSVDDGRWNNNGWLQELPDPITKLTWENAILVSPATASELGIKSYDIRETGRLSGQIAEITVGGRKVSGPVWIQPGQADNVLALGLGYGRAQTGRVGRNSGFNAYALRAANAPHFASGAKLVTTPAFHTLACTQSHASMEGRPMVREANASQYQGKPDFAKHMTLEEPPGAGALYPNPLEARASDVHQWGMAIDLTSCVGCNACVVACQSENNVPIVGKEMVGKSREMHWLRIDRYYAGPPEQPQVVNQPMLCQHCEAAPCENVCPVNATVHDHEGLNLMVYNRCVGTRYCSNNCPWKIRRFNYFNYNKRPLDNLYQSPIVQISDGKWELSRWIKKPEISNRPELEWELTKLVKNPDVSVRMRGVMEKCTFCVQRIEQAKIQQKVKAGPTGDVRVADGAFTTACAQACPADAIAFGNLLDPKSRVSKLKEFDRNYTTLEFLHTRPRLSYMARIRNPNPEMPDYYDMPLTLAEYTKVNGNPFTAHAAHAAGETGNNAQKPTATH
jgi:MoCo/4Fe-4S cofactor protein with predicted Tat translocation signal